MNKKSICSSLRPLREKVAEGRMRGFTLIELLVVVVIIAILAAIAVPQYKHATLKARFSTVMPMAKAIADAQEVYYQGRQLYALDVEDLDVTPVTAENTSVSLSQTDGYDYVMAQNSKVPGANYIIYQKYSENYPSEIHCEAEKDNADAEWLCSSLSNNNEIGVTLTKGYKTYLIKGSGLGLSPWSNAPTCDTAEEMGYTCSITANTAGEQVKKICQNGICRTKTYNEDGSYTSVTCTVSSDGVCTSNWKSVTYDANGNKLTQRQCSSVDSSGNCTAYATASTNYNYTYDANGNMLSQRQCYRVDSNGNCENYLMNYNYDYTYDENGNRLTQRGCNVNVDNNGICTAYSANYSYDYMYDANGNMVAQRFCCGSVDISTGNCASYSNYGYSYTYDANGNRLTERYCPMDSSGNCTTYQSSNSHDYTYDANGNMLSQRVCATVDSSTGDCTAYASSSSTNYDYTYDANGNKLTYRICSSVDSSTGNCTAYSQNVIYTYDDNGKQITAQSCSGNNVNTTTGECIAYNSSASILAN